MLQDFKYALRSLTRSQIFAASAIATLALGIGVNSTIFTLANGALFRSMPGVSAPSELMWLSGVWRDTGRSGGLSYLEYLDYRAHTTDVFSNVLAFAPSSFSVASGGEPQRIRGHVVSGSYFSALGVTAGAGRMLQISDDEAGAVPVAVISRRLSRQRFGGAIPDRPIVVNGRDVSVVGVAPEGFVGPEFGQSADIWVPMSSLPTLNSSHAGWLRERGTLWLRVMARRRADVSVQRAQAVVSGIAAALEAEYPDANTNRGAIISSASAGVRPSDRSELVPIAALLLGVTGLVLLIACANVSNLLLARGAGRMTELSIRAAVGASRWRIIRQLLAESLVLSVFGAAAGLLLAFWAADLLLARLPEMDFGGLQAAVDARVVFFTVLLAIGSTCVFGLTPALAVTQGTLVSRVRTTPRGGRSRTQGFFVIVQLSLSLVLLLGAGLTLRALQKASAIDLGFNSRGLFSASYDLGLQNYAPDRRDGFRRELTSRLQALPGIEAVAITDLLPLGGTMVSTVVAAQEPGGGTSESRAYMSSVGRDYFRTMEIPLVRGRGIDVSDRRGTPEVAVANETLARQLWSDLDPIGRTVKLDDRVVRIVGVARNAKYDEASEHARPFLYLALAQHSNVDREAILVRASSYMTTTALQQQIHALDPALPVFDVKPFEEVLRDRADKQRGIGALFAGFGVLALGLASLGLYGVMSYGVTRRTHEIGVRLALGATPHQLVRLIAADGLRLAITGVVIGSILGYPLARTLGALIFGVQMGDFATFAATGAVLVSVAMSAAVLPARRAAHLDPMAALRVD